MLQYQNYLSYSKDISDRYIPAHHLLDGQVDFARLVAFWKRDTLDLVRRRDLVHLGTDRRCRSGGVVNLRASRQHLSEQFQTAADPLQPTRRSKINPTPHTQVTFSPTKLFPQDVAYDVEVELELLRPRVGSEDLGR